MVKSAVEGSEEALAQLQKGAGAGPSDAKVQLVEFRRAVYLWFRESGCLLMVLWLMV